MKLELHYWSITANSIAMTAFEVAFEAAFEFVEALVVCEVAIAT